MRHTECQSSRQVAKMTEQSNGVIALLAKLVADLTKELAEPSKEEELAQTSYETLLSDSNAQNHSLAQEHMKRQTSKASEEELIVNRKADATSAKQLLAEHIASLQAAHTECGWLVQHFDARQELRSRRRVTQQCQSCAQWCRLLTCSNQNCSQTMIPRKVEASRL